MLVNPCRPITRAGCASLPGGGGAVQGHRDVGADSAWHAGHGHFWPGATGGTQDDAQDVRSQVSRESQGEAVEVEHVLNPC